MRVFKLMVLLVICSSLQYSNPTNFKIIGRPTINISISSEDKIELAEIKFKNTTSKDLLLNWKTTDLTFLKEWDYSMCAYGKCQVGIPKKGTLRKIPAGKTGFIAIHILPKGNKGSGLVKFDLYDPKNQNQRVRLRFNVEVK